MDAPGALISIFDIETNDESYGACYSKFISLVEENVSKEEFIQKYLEFCDAEWKEKGFYLVVLNDLAVTIMKGETYVLEKLDCFFACMNEIQDHAKIREYYKSRENDLKNTNVIILTCKMNKVGILKYLFNSEILNRISVDIGRSAISFKDEDEECNNAFYYSVRSKNIELLDTLIHKWPGGPLTNQALELEKILSNVYEALQLKNVQLSDEMHTYVENALIELRFFSDQFPQSPIVNNNFRNIIERIHIVNDYVSWLINNYSGPNRVDEIFLFLAKCIAQNVHILKQQLKSTYNKIPWEEMEFCLTSFISSYMEKREINFFYRVTINKIKMLRYLYELMKLLEDLGDFALFTDLPKEEPEIIKARIIDACPQFKALYADHRQLRDIYSLYKMNDYIQLALTFDPREKSGRLTILRALQVIGDCLRNTLESPKLSHSVSKLLLLTFSKYTRQVVMNLRDSSSHADSLAVRIKIEETSDGKFFADVQNDIHKVGLMIDGILHEKTVKVMSIVLKEIINTKSLRKLEEVAEAFSATKLNLNTKDSEELELCDLELLIKQLENTITDKTKYEEMLFQEILNRMGMSQKSRESKAMEFWTSFYMLQCVSFLLWNNNTIDNNSVKCMRSYARSALKNINLPVDFPTLKDIGENLQLLLSSIELRMSNDDSDLELQRIMYKISYLAECGIGTNERIERLWAKMNDQPPFRGSPLYRSKKRYEALLARKISELKYVLTDNAMMTNIIRNMSAYKYNKKLQPVIEILVLDILDGLDSAGDYLEDNLYFWDDNSPSLTGKCLRDHLAHDNTLVNVLLSDPTMMIALNAKKLVSEDIIKSKRKLGRKMTDDCFKLREKYERGFTTIIDQKQMFLAIQEARVDDYRYYIREGADIHGKTSNLWTALHFAARGSDTHIVNLLIDSDLNINVKDVDGQSPLHIAAANGRANIVQYLIESLYFDPNITDNCQRTPLHVAVGNGHRETVQILLAKNVLLDAQDISGSTPLHYAIRNNCLDIVEILMQRAAEIDSGEKAPLKFTPLHTAAESGHVEIVNYLIENQADVGARSNRYVTPLHLAVLNGHLSVARVLISNGANVNARVRGGCTPLYYAVENGYESIAILLLTYGAEPNVVDKAHNTTALHCAALKGYTNIVLSLLINEANVNVVSTMGMTPLHFAAQGGHYEVVSLLITRGADVNVGNRFGATPLYYAAKGGHMEVVKFLVEKKADVDVKNSGFAPLHAAAENKHEEIVNFLIKNKAKVNLRAKCGMTPLHVAVSSPYNENVVRHLLINKASVNIKNSYGMTALHMAASAGCVGNAVLLIEHKAAVDAATKDNQTPLHLAVRKGHTEIVRLLLEYGATVNTDRKVPRPLSVAVSHGHKEIVEILFKNGAIVDDGVENLSMLYSAVNFNYKEIVELLMANGVHRLQSGSHKVLVMAVNAGYSEIVDSFLRHGTRVNERYHDRNTILHVAAKTGYINIVDALISKGADVNAADNNKITPLHIAANEGHDEVVKLLVTNGATINVKSVEGNSPLHLAVWKGHCTIVKFLLDNGAKIDEGAEKNRTPLELAVTHDHLEVVQTLLEHKKFDLNSYYNGTKLLHIASQIPSLEMVKYLVDEGADVCGKNSRHSKAIHVAADKDITEYFLSKGLSVDEIDEQKKTPLHYAVHTGRLEVVQCLIDHGADVNAKSNAGTTPLHMAVKAKYKGIIELLLKNGAMYNCADKSSKLPSDCTTDEHVVELLTVIKKFFEAIKRNDANHTKKFIKAGAVVNVRDADNVTPLHYAARKGYDTVASILLENGAKPDAMSEGHTPLHYAAEFSHMKVVTILLSKGATYNVLSVKGKTPLDLTTSNDVRHLLTLISKAFKKVKKNDSSVILELKQIKDVETIRAVLNARDEDGDTLVVAGMHSNFSNIDMLKEVSQGNISDRIDAGVVLLEKGDYKGAFSAFKNAYDRTRSILGPENPATLECQARMAETMHRKGDLPDALAIYEDVCRKRHETLGSQHMATIDTRCRIALVLFRLEKFQEALDIFQDVYQIQEEVLGSNHEHTMYTEFQVGNALTELSRFEEAIDSFTALLEKTRSEYGMDHPSALRVQNSLAAVLDKEKKHDEALKMYEDLLTKQRSRGGKHHPDTFTTLHHIASILFHQNRYREALETYKQLLGLQTTVYGRDHPDTLCTHHSIISLHVRQGRRFAALKICLNVLPRMKAVLTSSHPVVQSTEKILEVIDTTFKTDDSDFQIIIDHMQEEICTAAAAGNADVVERMYKEGYNLNDGDLCGKTPLHHAAKNGHPRVVEFLLDHGAMVDLVCIEGNNPLHEACEDGHTVVVELLLDGISRDKLSEFVNAKTTYNGTTPLHIAAQNGFFDVVCCLLSYGAIYNIENDEGKTPHNLSHHVAVLDILALIEDLIDDAKKGNPEIINSLRIMKDARPLVFAALKNARNIQGNTILQVAISNRHKDIAHALLKLLK